MEKDNYQLPPVWDVITHLTQMLSKTEPMRKRLSEAGSILRRQIYENGPAGVAQRSISPLQEGGQNFL